MNSTKTPCPVCGAALVSERGTQLNPTDGVTAWCPSRACPAQEISGHGATEKSALNVIAERRLSSGPIEE